MPGKRVLIDLTEIASTDGRYSSEAYQFVIEGLDYARTSLGRRGHLSGQELSEGLRKLALERFGMLARVVLESWGVKSTADFGELVYILIKHKLLRKRPADSKQDFKEVYDFDQAFGNDYRIRGRGRHIRL